MLKTVASFSQPLEAYIVLGRLHSENISAYIMHVHHIWANWMYSQALGGVKIQIHINDIQRTEQILNQYYQGEFAQDLTDEISELAIEDEYCPQCPKYYSLIQLVIILMSFGLLGLIIPLPKRQKKCQQCLLTDH